MSFDQWKEIKSIKKEKEFKVLYERLICNDKQLIDFEIQYLLSCAILFYKYYQRDRRNTAFLNLSYNIILNYSVLYNDFKPLYDFSLNFGFYPISNEIQKYKNWKSNSIIEAIGDSFIKLKYKSNEGYIQSLEQANQSSKLLNSQENINSYIAPTSFGKSSLIVDYIKKELGANSNVRIGVIVPTKSLLQQTYYLIKDANLNKRILIHDEMYHEKDSSFIAVFTQERALRLINRNKVFFDILIIDEAHKMFDSGGFFTKEQSDIRPVLLARLVRKSKVNKRDLKLLYLSPLISDSDNLKFLEDEKISSHKLKFNIKAPVIFEYWKKESSLRLYDRFMDQFIIKERSLDYRNFLNQSFGSKNFFFSNTPIKVEGLALELMNSLPDLNDPELVKIQKVLIDNVHTEFYAVSLIKKGIIYLHGRMPDFIKEYLEDKFKNLSVFKYLVANSVVLEGINMPIDTMFIYDTHSIRVNDLINLIGRVNRLNTIFDDSSELKLNKLLPSIYFVDHNKNNKSNSKHYRAIKSLRSFQENSSVKNPLLKNFDESSLTNAEKVVFKDSYPNLIKYEELLSKPEMELSDRDKVLVAFINADIIYMYNDIDKLLDTFIFRRNLFLVDEEYNDILERILNTEHIKFDKNKGFSSENNKVLSLIYLLFIQGQEDNIKDKEFLRLQHGLARNYYWYFIYVSKNLIYKKRIDNLIDRLIRIKPTITDENLYYVGKSEITHLAKNNEFKRLGKDVYVDLRKLSYKEIVNVAINKIKIEDEFVDFKLSKFISLLYDFGIIPTTEYNQVTYGTENNVELELMKFGLSQNIVKILNEKNQISNLDIDAVGNIKVLDRSLFNKFLDEINELDQFQIKKIIRD